MFPVIGCYKDPTESPRAADLTWPGQDVRGEGSRSWLLSLGQDAVSLWLFLCFQSFSAEWLISAGEPAAQQCYKFSPTVSWAECSPAKLASCCAGHSDIPQTVTACPWLERGLTEKCSKERGRTRWAQAAVGAQAGQGRLLLFWVCLNGNPMGHIGFAKPREIISACFPLVGSIPHMLVKTKYTPKFPAHTL